MSSDPSFEDWLARLRRGDQEAASWLFQTFSRRLVGLARGWLQGLAPKADPDDVMASVLRSFFRRDAEEPFDLHDWDGLWALLTVITLRKCGHRTRHFRAARRDVRREVRPAPQADDSHADWEAIAREPTPAEAAELADTVAGLMRELDARDRPILVLGLQGYTAQEIAAQVGRAERTVYRALERIRGRLEQLRAADG